VFSSEGIWGTLVYIKGDHEWVILAVERSNRMRKVILNI
jgi:hypothetical protein